MTVTLKNTPASWTKRAAAACPLEAVGWTEDGQRDRFRAVLAALDPAPGESLLDFGCGTGALADHVHGDVGYLGVDWSPGMLERAQKDHPERLFADTLPKHTVDLIAAVGPFNLPHNWSKTRTWEKLRDLWALTVRALAVSLYAGTDKQCLQYDPGQVMAFARSNARLWAVDLHRENDLLLVMRR